MPQEARPRELEQADAGPTTPTRPVTASRSTAMSATLDIEEHDLDLSDALQQALLADQTDNATGSGRQDSTENQQGWEFAYGERAVLHGGKKVEQAGGDEGEGDSSDPGDSEGASSQNEDEQQDDDGRTQVKVNELSRWRVDGKIQGRVVAREEHEHIGEEAEHRQQIPEDGDSDSADSIRQDQSDGQAEDVVGSLSVNDSLQSNVSSSPLKRGGQSRLEQSDEKEDQSGLRDREAAEGQECFLCGEWGHGIRDCPYKEPEADLVESNMPEQDQMADASEQLEIEVDRDAQEEEEKIMNEARMDEAREQAEKEEGEQRRFTAAAIIQQTTRCWIARSRYYELLGGLKEQEEGVDESLKDDVESMRDAEQEAELGVSAETIADTAAQIDLHESSSPTAADETILVQAMVKSMVFEVLRGAETIAQQNENAAEELQRVLEAQEAAAGANNLSDVGGELETSGMDSRDSPSHILDILESLLISVLHKTEETDEQARKKASAEAEWRKIQQDFDAKAHLEAHQAEMRAAEEDEAAEKRRQEEAERMALTRTAVIMQKLFRGKVARGFARDLRELRLLQRQRFENEEKKSARNAVLVLMRRAPLQVLEFKRLFDAVVQEAADKYSAKCASIMATPDEAAQAAITESIQQLWADASIENEKAIAAALVNSARIEVRRGLVLGRVMTGALQRESLVKGLDKVNTVAQDCLSAALREHLPLTPETVEERMASLKISIEAKKRLQTYVELECGKVLSEMEEVTRAVKLPEPELMSVLACADPGSAMRQWEPLSHLAGNNLNCRMLKSRERTSTKQSIRHRSRTCQQRWQALVSSLDKCRSAFTDSVLGVSGGRGWDCTGDILKQGEYASQLADALSHLSPPSSSADSKPTVHESKILKRRIANLFAPKLTKPAKGRTDVLQHRELTDDKTASRWPDWEPGRFKPRHRDARYAHFACKPEPHFITEVGMRSPELEERSFGLKSYTILPPILAQNFDHALAKLDKEIHVRHIARDEKGQGRSNVPSAEPWNHIRQIMRLEHGAQPTKDLFPTPRRVQKWRDRIRNAEVQMQPASNVITSGGANYAGGGRDSVLSFISGAETRAQSRIALASSAGRATADKLDDQTLFEDDSAEACGIPTALGLLTSAVEEFERLWDRGMSSDSSKSSAARSSASKRSGVDKFALESRVLPDLA